MASRLYRTTQPLFLAVHHLLRARGLAQLGSPTLLGLIALYVTGLILLDARPTQTRVCAYLPARAHDALNRLLRCMPLSTRHLMRLLMHFACALGGEGRLILDEVVWEKAFAQRLPWASWTYSSTQQRQIYGVVLVLLLWCSDDGRWRIPVGFRLLRPKGRCAPHAYRTKLQLAQELVRAVLAAGLPVRYLVFDTHYTAGWFTKWLARCGVIWQGTLDPRTTVVYQGRKGPVRELAGRVKLKWRSQLGLRTARALTVYAPTYGHLRLCVAKNGHGGYEYLVSNAVYSDPTSLVESKRSRWSIETVFRDAKQFSGFAACQCWGEAALVRHSGLVLLTFVVLQWLRQRPDESVGAVKQRWQLAVLQQGEPPPPPLRACPRELRPTA
ncbi:MAG TPA: transposase [Chloroflexia bacterium]|nr:transposase [Chloroflexia bacterium]